MPFIPHTDQDIQKMLDTIGVSSIDDLFDEIPEHLRAKSLEGVPEGRSEMEMMQLLSAKAQQDSGALCFIGAGAYEHHVPAAVWDIASRGEFMTAYTPYQAEASQGTLQLIYEYQSMMCQLTAMDVSNASLYDGASGLAEAVLMAIRGNRKSKSRKVLVAGSLHPLYEKTVKSIVDNQEIDLELVALGDDFRVDQNALAAFEGEDYAALVIQQPNFFGALEDVNALTDWGHVQGMLVIGVVNPTAMALLAPPGEWGETGADIAVGDGQPLGLPLASGGPYFGFICCTSKLVRQMPGRIIGRTIDTEGREGFTLTLQAREQHIRRSKATSNICTNQGLAVTAATVYMTLLGFDGLGRVASACHANAKRLASSVNSIDGVSVVSNGPWFHEFVIELPLKAADVLKSMASSGVLAGLALNEFVKDASEYQVLVCVTETRTDEDLERYAEVLSNALSQLGGK